MIWREFCKYGRRFRWLILLYVSWIALTTFLTATHQAFVSESAAMRRFAMEIEPNTTIVTMLLLVVFLVALWFEDCIWEPKAFWKPRPISPRDQIMAKMLWLALLAGLLPAISGGVTTFTAQMGWAETLAFASFQGAFYIALGSFVSTLALISKRWEEMPINLVMHLPLLLLHGPCWMFLGNSFPAWLVYLILVTTCFGAVLTITLRKDQQSKALFASLLALLITGFVTILLLRTEQREDRRDSEVLATLTTEGDHLAMGRGIKAAIDSENPTAPKFRYWYQTNLLGQMPIHCQIDEWAPGSSGGNHQRIGIVPGRSRVMGSQTLSGHEESGASIRERFY